MRNRLIISLLLFTSLVLAACSSQPGTSNQSGLSVTATGSVYLAPDVVDIDLGVQTQAAAVGSAVAKNNRLTAAVMAALADQGLASSDIQTSYFSVTPQQRYDDTGTPTGDVTYWVDNIVHIKLHQPDKLGEVLQAAIAAGANSVQGVTYSVSDPSQAQAEARQKAIDIAQARAHLLASAAGATLGEPLTINAFVGLPGPRTAGAAAAEEAPGSSVPVSPGSLEVQAQVTITYPLR
ncbi:MAG TPA: SIMPL domain-containing protein [Anaerolineales bacterium]|nr:SIMPL domain-containing protein [Anaerolineales bacterium]